MPNSHYVIAGAGLAGAVLARELAEALDCRITIFETKNHIAGNCYTERDPATQIMVHKYRPHIFNTNREDVWNYVNRFAARVHPREQAFRGHQRSSAFGSTGTAARQLYRLGCQTLLTGLNVFIAIIRRQNGNLFCAILD
jgi:choline dehydrogenase-like flavoprotein